jgi:hypothetical protein
MAVYQVRHDDPLGDLRAMGAGRCTEGDIGILVDWMLCEMVCSGGEALDEASFWDVRGGDREP